MKKVIAIAFIGFSFTQSFSMDPKRVYETKRNTVDVYAGKREITVDAVIVTKKDPVKHAVRGTKKVLRGSKKLFKKSTRTAKKVVKKVKFW